MEFEDLFKFRKYLVRPTGSERNKHQQKVIIIIINFLNTALDLRAVALLHVSFTWRMSGSAKLLSRRIVLARLFFSKIT